MTKRVVFLSLILTFILFTIGFSQESLINTGIKAGEGVSTTPQELKAIKEGIKSLDKSSQGGEGAVKQTEVKEEGAATILSEGMTDLSEVEGIYKKYIGGAKKLGQFGYNFFSRQPKVDWNIPVPSDYRVGPGDSLSLYLWGDPIEILGLPGQVELFVEKDGTIFIPNLGVFPVTGLTLKEVQELLYKSFSTRFKKLSLTVTFGKIRGINVYIAGEVVNPGITTVRATSSIIEALSSRGGIKKTGTLRNVVVKRIEEGKTTTFTIDFYRLLIKGEPLEFKLKEGDVIYVNPIGNTIGILGSIKRAGIYEIKEDVSIRDVLELSGGLLPSAYKYRVQVESFDEQGRKFVRDDIPLENASEIRFKNGDLITFYPASGIYKNIVEIFGSIEHAGIYEWEKHEMLSALLERAKVLADADLERGFIIRKTPGAEDEVINFSVIDILSGKYDIRLQPLDRVWINKREPLEGITVAGEVITPLKVPFKDGIKLSEAISYAKLQGNTKSLKAEIVREEIDKDPELKNKRVVYLYKLFYKYKSEIDISLKPGDIILIKPILESETPFTVRIEGEINRPGIYTFKPGIKISDLIELAGKPTERGYLKGLIILREGLKRAQEEQLKINIITLEEMLAKSSSAYSVAGDLGEEKALLQMTLERQRQTINALKTKAELMLGRIALDIPSTLEELKNSPEDIELEEGDYIFIPPKPNFITVMGDVFNQIGIPYREGKTLSYYLNQAGGITKSGDEKSIYVIKATGRVISRLQDRSWFFSSFEDIVLEPGDAIIVPTEIKIPTLWRPIIKDIVQIIFQSLSTAVLAKRL